MMKYFLSCLCKIQLIGLTLIISLAVNQDPAIAFEQKLNILETFPIEQVKLLDNNLNLRDFLNDPNQKINANELLQLTVTLRDIARFLSPKWPLIINLDSSQQSLVITDFRTAQSDWIPLTVGYGLKLVSQELSILEHSREDTTIDLLIADNQSDIESQWLNVPLADFCSLLYYHLQQSEKS